MGDAIRPQARAWRTARAALDARPTPVPPAAPADDDDGQLRMIDLRDVPSRWPTMQGMVSPAPDAWRWRDNAERLAVVDAFYRDLLWNVQLELDDVAWPGRGTRDGVSILAACRDVARLWHLPASEETLPAPSRRAAARRARLGKIEAGWPVPTTREEPDGR